MLWNEESLALITHRAEVTQILCSSCSKYRASKRVMDYVALNLRLLNDHQQVGKVRFFTLHILY